MKFLKVVIIIAFLFISPSDYQTKESMEVSDPEVCNIETKEVCSYDAEREKFYNCTDD